MMLSIWLATLCALPTAVMPRYLRADHLIREEKTALVVLDPHAAAPNQQRLEGARLVTLVADGFLFRDSKGLAFYRLGDGKQQRLPEPPDQALQIELPWVSGPAVFTRDALHVIHEQRWVSLPVPIWYDFATNTEAAGAVHGLIGRFPQVTQDDGGRYLIYQPKSGKLLIWQPADGKHRETDADEDMRLVRIAGHAMWLGNPNDRNAALVDTGAPTKGTQKTRIAGLNSYSPLQSDNEGLWVLGFSDGWRDMLAAWKSGKIDVNLNYLRYQAGRLDNQTSDLPDMPLSLTLTTSNSGSPRSDVQPGFTIIPVLGAPGHLALVQGDQLRVYRAGLKAAVHTIKLAKQAAAPEAVVRREQEGFVVFYADGKSVALAAKP